MSSINIIYIHTLQNSEGRWIFVKILKAFIYRSKKEEKYLRNRKQWKRSINTMGITNWNSNLYYRISRLLWCDKLNDEKKMSTLAQFFLSSLHKNEVRSKQKVNSKKKLNRNKNQHYFLFILIHNQSVFIQMSLIDLSNFWLLISIETFEIIFFVRSTFEVINLWTKCFIQHVLLNYSFDISQRVWLKNLLHINSQLFVVGGW
jgi:hypothetical protein